MGTYRYISLGTEIPAIPIVPLELIQPGKFEHPAVVGQAILDTGSDCTKEIAKLHKVGFLGKARTHQH
jgi:hypothetical protein